MKILVTGAGGLLGTELVRRGEDRRHEVEACNHADLDITDDTRVRARVRTDSPDVVMHCAAWTAVDAAESDEAGALRVNGEGTLSLARAAAEASARVVYISTDYVFDGSSARPYRVTDTPAPINAYGRSKLAGERAVRGCDALIVRTSWLFGIGGSNFVSSVIARARAGEPLRVVNDQTGAPTSTHDLADIIFDLVEAGVKPGIYHATNAGTATWFDLAVEALALAGVSADLQPVPTVATQRPAPRPAYSVLDCSATSALIGPARGWRDALAAAIAAGLGAEPAAAADRAADAPHDPQPPDRP